jgi:hypothetical protein
LGRNEDFQLFYVPVSVNGDSHGYMPGKKGGGIWGEPITADILQEAPEPGHEIRTLVIVIKRV